MQRILIATLTVILSGTNYCFASSKLPADSAGHYYKGATERRYTAPSITDNTLFYIQRDPNSNTIMYELNTTGDGSANTAEPVHIYWIKYNEHGQKEELNYIQRKFAYGLTVKQQSADNYDIRFVSYKKFPMTLMKGADRKFHIFAFIANKEILLKSLFVRVEGGSFWITNILYVEVKGTDTLTGREVADRFKP